MGVRIIGLGGPVGAHPHHKHAKISMLTQQEFVEGCLAQYEEIYLQPGNPEDGEWHECHYPKPKCLGGTETVFLLKKHHAVQGVLQSEEYQHPCIYGWEKAFLQGETLERWKKWMAVKAQAAVDYWRSVPVEVKSELGRQGQAKMTKEQLRRGWEGMRNGMSPEQIREHAKHMHNITPEERRAAVKKATESNLKRNPDHFSDMAKKARNSESPEQKSARGRAIPAEASARGRALTNSRKFRCLVSGKVMPAGPLSAYQKRLGIDTSLREEVTPSDSALN